MCLFGCRLSIGHDTCPEDMHGWVSQHLVCSMDSLEKAKNCFLPFFDLHIHPTFLCPFPSKEHACVLALLNNSNFLFFVWRIIVASLPSLVSQNMFSFGSDSSVCTTETQCSETSHEFYSHAIRFWKLITHCYGEEKHLKKSMGNYTEIRSSERLCKFIKPYKYKMSSSKGQPEHLLKPGKSLCK